ncbi:MAG: 50S ribosomal protein L11 methyltransferase [Burkholderiales bacterium]|jgi:ribosomal protein L11 methyltransferase|nr:50S ribosomal protein L11 methyltransferase [Burkholderiales bacterium]
MYELMLQAPESLVESVSDALMDELDALSVSVEDSDADTDAEHALFGEPGMPAPSAGWARSTLKALFETEAAASEAATLLLAQDWATQPGASVSMSSLHKVEEQDWVRLTQSQFDPVEITPEFWIVPTWHEPPAGARRVIRLDPGMAFGTGTHPTTRMCLGWIAAHAADIAGRRVLDYGCGSGILAIGAAMHGGMPIDAVDIDPAAISTTVQNAADNGVTLRSGAPDMAAGEYPLVLANILATPLKMLAPLLCGHVAAGGHLVLAGILERQADELKAAYAPWIALVVSDTVDGWILMTGRKPA